MTTFLRPGLMRLVLTACFLLCATTAAAQSDEELSRARAAFQRGIELEQGANWAEALRTFREVGQVKMTPQVRFHIALCEEKLGRLVTALGGYELALADADSVGESFKAEVEQSVSELQGRIPKVIIERGEGATAAAIVLDGVDLGDSSVGVEVPVDPGPHTVAASAHGFEEFSTTVDVAEGDVTTVEVVLVPLPDEPEPEAKPLPTTSAEPRVLEPGQRYGIVPYVVMGGGGVFVLASVAVLVLRQSLINDLTENCTRTSGGGYSCPEKYKSDVDTYGFYNIAWPVAGGIGVAAIGAGLALFLLDRGGSVPIAEPADEAAHLRLLPHALGADLGGFSLTGSF